MPNFIVDYYTMSVRSCQSKRDIVARREKKNADLLIGESVFTIARLS